MDPTPGLESVSFASAYDKSNSHHGLYRSQLNSYCTNIAEQVGKAICVGAPGGAYQPTATVPPVTGNVAAP